jgi:hypothetical protein
MAVTIPQKFNIKQDVARYVMPIFKMETGRNFAMSGINSEHHNLPTYEFYTPTHIAITLSVRPFTLS